MKPQLSIVIISYNQFSQTTGPCLESLAAIREPLLEIVVVDNGSDPGTVAAVKQAAESDRRIRLVLHRDNRGFAAANNVGVELARAPFILLLNSDTLVPARAPALFLDTLRSNTSPCLVGPVTNAAGNEQRIYFPSGSDEAEILRLGEQWCGYGGGCISTDQLSFFCVAMARQTYLDLGGLDPIFGLGFYEDTDFCCRAADRGCSLLIAENIFIYHKGSASFSRADVSVNKILRANRRLFRKRHGRREGMHVRWKNLSILENYLHRPEHGEPFPAAQFANRLARAEELVPNSPLKKMIYHRKLSRVQKRGQAMDASCLGKDGEVCGKSEN